MKRALVFQVAGTPRPQPRPRFSRGRVVSTADPKAKLWRQEVERACRLALANAGTTKPMFKGAVRLSCTFTFAPPPSKRDRIGQPHTHKPDASNLLKLVEDVMEAAGVFANDSQIVEPVVAKWWGAKPGLAVLVEDASEDRRPEPSAADVSPPEWLLVGLGLRR